MKVILTKDVKKMGRAHETVEVSDGHAINYLIPNKLAVTATSGNKKAAETRKAKVSADKEVKIKLLAQNIASLAEARIVIKAKANDQGHLYDGIGEPEIAAAAKEQAHIDLPEDAISIERPFKEVGTFEVPVSAGEVFGKFSIIIAAE
ncbi:MAG TPA: 50S ribosomal protein L9 [Candidatus Paceibacterota bacterium]